MEKSGEKGRLSWRRLVACLLECPGETEGNISLMPTASWVVTAIDSHGVWGHEHVLGRELPIGRLHVEPGTGVWLRRGLLSVPTFRVLLRGLEWLEALRQSP